MNADSAGFGQCTVCSHTSPCSSPHDEAPYRHADDREQNDSDNSQTSDDFPTQRVAGTGGNSTSDTESLIHNVLLDAFAERTRGKLETVGAERGLQKRLFEVARPTRRAVDSKRALDEVVDGICEVLGGGLLISS